MKENELNLTKAVFDEVEKYIPVPMLGDSNDFRPLRDNLTYLTAKFSKEILLEIENYKAPPSPGI